MLIKDDVIKDVSTVCEKYADIFTKVVLFGSVARDEIRDGSDIDLYIESNITTGKLLTSKRFSEFTLEIYNLYDDKENIEFDLLVYGGKRDLTSVKKSSLYRQIEKDGIVLYDKRAKDI